MRKRLLPTLIALLCACTATTAAAQSKLQLRWELLRDTTAGDRSGSWAQFTLTNHDTKPLPRTGWAIYFSALHSALLDSNAAFLFQDVMADLQRLPAGPRSSCSPPGAPRTGSASAPGTGVALDFAAAPFTPATGVVTPAMQFSLDSATRDIPASDLPPILPTPVQVK